MSLLILKEMNCPEWVITHSQAVNLKAISLSENLSKKFDIDMDLVGKGALLHDIGRSMTDGIYHAVVGAKILKSEEYPLEIIKIVERHIGAGIPKEEAIEMGLPPKDFMPLTLEEKIVAHADNLVHQDQEVDIDMDLVGKGALVHDIGRCMTDGIYHAVVGAEILKSEGYPLEIIKIV
ncbi:MAG TPA: TIGR00295 family protein, partial [Methanobacteriaceae archaeon]|nr:TIGR00295 family protein [Methanobacteriaceae archaeon]